MPEKYIDLKDHINEVEKDCQKGLKRIQDYYDGRKENPSLRDPPHEILEKVASQFFREAIGSCLIRNDNDFKNQRSSSLYEVCIGCGTEILMKAIILLKSPERFIENPRMSFEGTKKEVMKLLTSELNNKAKERISDVLKLIQLKRNKWAHLSFHKFSAYHESYQIFQVLEYFYSKYFPDSEILEDIRDHKEGNKVESSLDFEPMEFK